MSHYRRCRPGTRCLPRRWWLLSKLGLAVLVVALWLLLRQVRGDELAPRAASPRGEEWIDALKGLIGPMAVAVIGLLWGRAEDLRRGRPHPPLKIMLLVDVPTAAGIGISVGGLALWVGAPLPAVLGVVALSAKLGTDWLLGEALPRLIAKYFPPKE